MIATVAAVYWLMPWWLPEGWIADRIVRQLQSDLHRPVTIGELRISWGEGIELTELTIGRREGFGEGSLLTVESLNVPFAPVDLVKGRLSRLSIRRAHVYVVLDDAGRANISDLAEVSLSGPRIDEVLVDESRLHVLHAADGTARQIVIDVPVLQVHCDRATGRTEWVFQAAQSGGAEPTFLGRGSTVGRAGAELGGEVTGDLHLSAHRLDLGALGLMGWLNSQLPGGVQQLAGSCSGSLSVALSGTDGSAAGDGIVRLDCRAEIDMTDSLMQLNIPTGGGKSVAVTKPLGDRLSLGVGVRVDSSQPDLQLDRLQVRLGDNTIDCNGIVEGCDLGMLLAGGGVRYPIAAELSVQMDAPRLDQAVGWVNGLGALQIEGRGQAAVRLFAQFQPSVVVYLEDSTLDGSLGCRLWGSELGLQLRDVQVSSSRLLVPEATVWVGQNTATIVADVAEPILPSAVGDTDWQRPTGRIDILAESIDVDSVSDWLEARTQAGGLGGLVRALQWRAPNAWAGDVADRIVPLLRRCDLHGSINARQFNYTDPKNGAKVSLTKLLGDYMLGGGRADARFRASLNAGVVNGQFACDLNAADAAVSYQQSAQNLQADERLAPMVEAEFPGMEVSGTISEEKALTGSVECLLSDGPCYWAGTGSTECTDGVLYGPGGPGWMIKVFPGLKLVEYQWERMRNEYECFSDGLKNNEMLFTGAKYDIYIKGTSRAIREPNEYAEAATALRTDLQQSRKELAEVDSGRAELKPKLAERLRRRVEGLDRLWRLHEAGRRQEIYIADYVVGGLLPVADTHLRVPIFRSRSYVMGGFMVGIETFNVSLAEVGRESVIYRLINSGK